jgi:RNA polymerase sigma factor (sigma-70 family)
MSTKVIEQQKLGDLTPESFLQQLTAVERETYSQISLKLDWMDHDSFHASKAEDRYFGLEAMEITIPQWNCFVDDVQEIFPTTRSSKSKLNGREEKELFLRYNYARYRLGKLLRSQLNRRSLGRARQMCGWQERVRQVRAELTRANMALVLAMAKRTRIPNVDFTELVSEGNMALLRSIEKFDASRGFKFSTYACRAILKSFNRLASKTGRYRQHFPTEYDPDMEQSDYDVKRHDMQEADSVAFLREIISQNRANLTDTERKVVMERFALGTDLKRGRTLSQVGEVVGLTNERVRQLQNSALEKLRRVLNEEQLVA